MHTRLTRRRAVWLCLPALAALAVVLLTGTSNAARNDDDQSIQGHMRNIANISCSSATTVCSTFQASGDIRGQGLVNVDTPPSADGISKAHTVIHTRKGDLTCHEQAIFDLSPGDHPFVDLCLIDGGTGIYQGATGYIQEVGTFDFAANVGQLDYYGKLVLANGEEDD